MYHFQDVFYNSSLLTKDEKNQILNEAKELCERCYVDIKKENSWTRERIDLSFEKILKKIDDHSHFVIIHRKGFVGIVDDFNWCLEIGFSTFKTKDDYFLWIYLKEDKIDYFVNKYKLQIL